MPVEYNVVKTDDVTELAPISHLHRLKESRYDKASEYGGESFDADCVCSIPPTQKIKNFSMLRKIRSCRCSLFHL